MAVYRCVVANSPHIIADNDKDALEQFQNQYAGIRTDVVEVRIGEVWHRLDRLPARDPHATDQRQLPLIGGALALPDAPVDRFVKLGFGAVRRANGCVLVR